MLFVKYITNDIIAKVNTTGELYFIFKFMVVVVVIGCFVVDY